MFYAFTNHHRGANSAEFKNVIAAEPDWQPLKHWLVCLM